MLAITDANNQIEEYRIYNLGNTVQAYIAYTQAGIYELKGMQQAYTFEVYNQQGQKVLNGNNTLINLQQYNKGVYVIKVVEVGGKHHTFAVTN
jgi:hypothetical protein